MLVSWYERPLAGILKELEVDVPGGLSREEVAKRKKIYGLNKLPEGRKLRAWQLFFGQFKNPLIFILLIAAFATLWFGQLNDFIIISLAVIVNVMIGFWQEFRSNKMFEKLHELVKVNAHVRRDGKIEEIDMSELVPGDIILLRGDTKIPADARLVSVSDFKVDESVLTGESSAVKKEIKNLTGNIAVGDRINMVYMGTIAEKGDAVAVVVGTGSKTEIGRIAELAVSVKDEKTPLQERLARLGRKIAFFVSIFAVIIFVTGSLEGNDVAQMFALAVAVAVAAIPEGLPAALSVVLAVSAQRILSKKGLVKKLIGAETLGSTSVIVTDKTGTLTTGKMVVEKLICAGDEGEAALALALASNFVMVSGADGRVRIRGEATDRAKADFFIKRGGNLALTLEKYKRCAFLPFDQETKRIVSFHVLPDGSAKLFVTGAPEILLGVSGVNEAKKKEIIKEVEAHAGRGFRMIGIAERTIKNGVLLHCDDHEYLEKYVDGLAFIGVAALRDPIREDVRESVVTTRRAGVRIIMATGDHRLTAGAIGKELGFKVGAGSILNGREIDELSDDELARRINEIEIFSRVSPEHKMRVIRALKRQGAVVAMTGDGVNDAPALKAADIGVALGSGTDIAKEAADLVLMDNSFSIITAAIKQGRIAFNNIRKVAVFLLSNSFTEIIVITVSLILRTPLPITAVQILWANLVENSFPNFALAFEPGEKDVMDRKPLRRKEPILDKQGLTIIFIIGIIADFALVGIFLFLLYLSGVTRSIEHIQTIVFTLLATDSFFNVLAIKSYHESILRTKFFDNLFLLVSIVFGIVMIFVALYVPQLQRLLGTVALSGKELLFIFIAGTFHLIAIEGAKWWFRKRGMLRIGQKAGA